MIVMLVRCVGVSGLSMDEFYGVLCWLWVAILGCNPGYLHMDTLGVPWQVAHRDLQFA